MDFHVSNKRSRPSPATEQTQNLSLTNHRYLDGEDESTDLKLATLASLHPDVDQATLLDLLVSAEGSVDAVSEILSTTRGDASGRKRSAAGTGHQSSLAAFRKDGSETLDSPSAKRRALTRKGQTLHLYTPEDIAAHTPCSITHNFLPNHQADELLKELLKEAPTFESQTFKLFDNVVQSPHTACFYVDSLEEQKRQKTEYLYNGSFLEVRFRLHSSDRSLS
jgi:hypothetical protein